MAHKADLEGRTVILGFSGGPDAAALALRIRKEGARVIPVYVNYRASLGGKSSKDLATATKVAVLLGLATPGEIRRPLGRVPKSHRNRHFVRVLGRLARHLGCANVGLGTIQAIGAALQGESRASRNDLDPGILQRHGEMAGVRVITWDSFGVTDKAQEFADIVETTRHALFTTTSCQMWFKLECGNCHSCLARHRAFMDAFGEDRTHYRPNSCIGRQSRQRRP